MAVDFGNLIIRNPDTMDKADPLPTGIPILDNDFFGIGGLARGRVSEWAAYESQGKSTVLLNITGLLQKQGYSVLYADAEGSLTKDWAEKCGVNWEELAVIQPMPAESFINTLKMAIASNEFDLCIVDSISVFNPQDIGKSKNITDITMHDNLKGATLMKHFLNSLISGFSASDINGKAINSKKGIYTFDGKKEKLDKSLHRLKDLKTHVAFIAHLADKPGLTFGDPHYTSGGKKKDFTYSQRIKIFSSKVTKKKQGKDVFLGKTVKFTLWKSKVSTPWTKVELFLNKEGRLEFNEAKVLETKTPEDPLENTQDVIYEENIFE